MWWSFGNFCSQTHTSDSVLPVALLLSLSGPRLPGVQLYYKAQDQEQQRAAYFRKRVTPLLLDMLTHTRCRAFSHIYVSNTSHHEYDDGFELTSVAQLNTGVSFSD